EIGPGTKTAEAAGSACERLPISGVSCSPCFIDAVCARFGRGCVAFAADFAPVVDFACVFFMTDQLCGLLAKKAHARSAGHERGKNNSCLRGADLNRLADRGNLELAR